MLIDRFRIALTANVSIFYFILRFEDSNRQLEEEKRRLEFELKTAKERLLIVEREFDSRALEKEQISQEISSTRIELRKLENELQNALRKLNDANDDVTAKQNRVERLERELEDQRRANRSHDLDREQRTNQVS